MHWDIVISILTGLVTAIPLVVKLVEYVRLAVRERNWNQLLKLVMSLMAQAEEKFETGAKRKEWVMSMVEASANLINYDVDKKAVADLIDSLCGLTKQVNAPLPEA